MLQNLDCTDASMIAARWPNQTVQVARRILRTMAVLGFAMALSHCATYHPLPLAKETHALSSTEAAVLTQAASTIDRTYLKPLRLTLDAPLDLNAIAVIAVLNNPELQSLRARAGVAEAQVFAARLLPDPALSGGFDPLLSGPDPMAAILGQLTVDLAALRSRQVTLASEQASSQAVRLDLAWMEWQTAGQARLLAIRTLALGQVAALAEESRKSADAQVLTHSRATQRGDLREADGAALRSAAMDASTLASTANHELAAARLDLARVLGLTSGAQLQLSAPSERVLKPLPDAENLSQIAISQRLDLRALAAGYASQEAVVHKAVLDQFPNLSLTVTGQRDTSGNVLLGPSVAFTLPLWNRNRGGIAVAEATRAALKAEYSARMDQTRSEVTNAVETLGAARRQHRDLELAIPALSLAVQRARAAASRGDLNPSLVAINEQALRDKRIQLVHLKQSESEQWVSLELLTGVPEENW